MTSLVDVVEKIVHDESSTCLDLSIFVLPCSALPNVNDSTPLPLDCSTHGDFFQIIQVDLNVLILNSFGIYDHVHVEM